MELTADNVEVVLIDCLPKELSEETVQLLVLGQAVPGLTFVRGVKAGFCFVNEKLEAHREDVKSMLMELPEQFRKSKGGGWSFLSACMTKDGVQWGEHLTIDKLITLGIALKLVEILLPREAWRMLPGGLPYFAVID